MIVPGRLRPRQHAAPPGDGRPGARRVPGGQAHGSHLPRRLDALLGRRGEWASGDWLPPDPRRRGERRWHLGRRGGGRGRQRHHLAHATGPAGLRRGPVSYLERNGFGSHGGPTGSCATNTDDPAGSRFEVGLTPPYRGRDPTPGLGCAEPPSPAWYSTPSVSRTEGPVGARSPPGAQPGQGRPAHRHRTDDWTEDEDHGSSRYATGQPAGREVAVGRHVSRRQGRHHRQRGHRRGAWWATGRRASRRSTSPLLVRSSTTSLLRCWWVRIPRRSLPCGNACSMRPTCGVAGGSRPTRSAASTSPSGTSWARSRTCPSTSCWERQSRACGPTSRRPSSRQPRRSRRPNGRWPTASAR